MNLSLVTLQTSPVARRPLIAVVVVEEDRYWRNIRYCLDLDLLGEDNAASFPPVDIVRCIGLPYPNLTLSSHSLTS